MTLADDLLRQFGRQQGEDPAYGLVFQLSQNWILDIHINTLQGLDEIPTKMRDIANWGKELTDGEWLEKTGIWYTPAWKHGELQGELATTINDYHYDLFEALFASATESGDSDLLLQKVDEARLSAIETARNSEVFADVLKTGDFTAHVVDEDGLEYHTKAPIGG